MDTQRTATSIQEALAAPFGNSEVRFRPGATSGNRAMALPYLSARAVMDRLDDVLGVDGWEDHYALLPDGSAVCTLRCRIGGTWVTKQDVGSPSEQSDAGDRVKAAFSDSLKRAAVKFSVGRYLYRLPPTWVEYDPVKKQLLKTPSQPAPRPTLTPAVQAANRIRGSQLAANGV